MLFLVYEQPGPIIVLETQQVILWTDYISNPVLKGKVSKTPGTETFHLGGYPTVWGASTDEISCQVEMFQHLILDQYQYQWLF